MIQDSYYSSKYSCKYIPIKHFFGFEKSNNSLFIRQEKWNTFYNIPLLYKCKSTFYAIAIYKRDKNLPSLDFFGLLTMLYCNIVLIFITFLIINYIRAGNLKWLLNIIILKSISSYRHIAFLKISSLRVIFNYLWIIMSSTLKIYVLLHFDHRNLDTINCVLAWVFGDFVGKMGVFDWFFGDAIGDFYNREIKT